MVTDKTVYKDDSIESLDPREHVRLRPGMYAGDTSNPNQLLLEIFSNALDEYNLGHGNKIFVEIAESGFCLVQDFAQGFPINVVRPEDGKTVLEASFSVMNTSGKFSDDGVYGGTSLGLNGIGSKLTNFLSSWLSVRSGNGKKEEHLHFKDGILDSREVLDSNLQGTIVEWMPDPQFFETNLSDVKFFENFFEDITCLCPGLTVQFKKPHERVVEIKHSSFSDILSRKIGNNIEIINTPFILDEDGIDMVLTFTGNSTTDIITYVNYGNTTVGPHITAIKSTITRIMNNWAKENGILKSGDKNLDGASLQEGMVLVSNIVSTQVAYNAQVKTTITKMDTTKLTAVLAKQLEVWLDNNPNDGKAIIEKALIARKAAEAAKKARAAVKNKAEQKEKVFKLPTTLSDSWSKNRERCELFVCEGKSAASGLVAARDSEFQSVYGVRGKMLSVLKTTPENIVKNQEINNLLQALGLDYNPSNGKCVYDKNKLRYGKIIAAADADFDGFAIENLLFNILWYICPDLIIEGHVYSAVPPLYKITTKKNEYIYIKDDKELDEYKQVHNNIAVISRHKGLGEQNSDELAYSLLDPETRNLYQLTVSDIGATDIMFNNLYGRAVEPRVKFLSEHLEEARID